MKPIRYIFALAAVAAMTACSDDDKDIQKPETIFTTVTVDAEVGRESFFSRAGVLENGEAQRFFSAGDVIGLSDGKSDERYTFDGNGWTPAAKGFEWGNYSVEYRGWYPASASYDTFSLPTDQSTAGKLQSADYMTATRTVDACPSDGVLLLDFNRHMARVMLYISGIDKSNGEIESITVQSPGSRIPSDGMPVVVTPYAAGDGRYVALVTPGEANPDGQFITITTTTGKKFNVTGIPAISGAYSYNYDLYLGKSDITISKPVVEEWKTGGTLAGTLADVTDETDPGFFVTPEGRGDKSGATWENAMDLKSFRDKIHRPNAAEINDMTFYLAEGDYDMFSDYRGETTIADPNKTQLYVTIKGGYDATLSGTDTSRRDIHTNATRFIRSAAPPTWKTKFFYIGDKANVTFDGIDFEGGYNGSEGGNLLCIHTSYVAVTIDNCVINGFSHTGEGAAVYAEGTKLKIANSTISNCVCEQGAVASRNGTGYNMLNNVVFTDNTAYGKWGVHVNSKHPLLMNNVTMYNEKYSGTATDNSSPMINANGNAFFMANSTLYSTICDRSRHDGSLRLSLSGGESIVINNLLGSSKADDMTMFDGDGHRCTSAGYNVFMKTTPNISMGGNDLALTTFPAPSFSGNFISFGTFDMPSFATLGDIMAACAKSKSNEFQTLGAEFADWVGDDFGLDCRGNRRNTSKMNPGAFDPGL